jgi:hypothetical protein
MEQINFEEILTSTPVKYFDWGRCKSNTPTVYQGILKAMKEVWNLAIQKASKEVKCKSDGDYLIPEIDKESILKLKI